MNKMEGDKKPGISIDLKAEGEKKINEFVTRVSELQKEYGVEMVPVIGMNEIGEMELKIKIRVI